MTTGRGVDLVVEVGGQDTLRRSIASTRMGGTVAIIGGVSGFGGDIGVSTKAGQLHSAFSTLVDQRP